MFAINEATVTTPTGQLTYWLHHPTVPSDTLLLTFSSTRQAAFYEDPYDIPAQLFAAAGHAVVSFDLPNHGEQVDQFGSGIEGFCAAVCADADPFVKFIEQSQAVIAACLAQGSGRGGIVACGVSRAAYCVLRLAAADPRIRAVAGLAPVTDWRCLREFSAVRHQPAVAALALDRWVEPLAERAIYLAIGNHDDRVGSDACVSLVLRLLERRATYNNLPPTLQFYLVDSPGHSLADEWRRAGAEFLLERGNK